MEIRLSDHFNYRKLLRYTYPSIIMLVFSSVYGVVDGFFVSNFVGKTAFTAVNLIYPVLIILGSVGFMFGTGGGALIGKTMGEGKREMAQNHFSLIVYTSIVCGFVLGTIGIVFIRPMAMMLGAKGQLLEDSVIYARIILLSLPAYVLQYEFQCLFATAGKPSLGLTVTVWAGVTNMVLDGLFVAVLDWGLEGAAAATALSQVVGGVIPLIYFAGKNSSLLKLGKTSFDRRVLGKACVNGSSELLSNISMSVVSILYNFQLLRFAGEDGVAAYGVLMYVSLIFQAVFIGYAVGSAPVVSYHYGAGNPEELHSLLKKSLLLIGCFSILMFGAALVLASPLSKIFVGYDRALYLLTVHAFGIFSFSFLFSGFAILGSSFFTALNDGPVSAAISFLRTMVFQVAAVIIFPIFWEVDGIWISIAAAELLAMVTALLFLKAKRKKYHY